MAGSFFSSVPLMVVGLEDFRVYLGKCFDFEQVTVKKFRTWAERRQFNRDMKRKQAESERPILPANQKLITLSVQDAPTKKGTIPTNVSSHKNHRKKQFSIGAYQSQLRERCVSTQAVSELS